VISIRESPVSDPNEKLKSLPAREGEGNAAWLSRAPLKEGVILLGGTSLVDFRIRFAQSQLRSDLTPSYWSTCGLLSQDGSLRTVPFELREVSSVPRTNAVRTARIEDFDDAEQWPNVAVVQFAQNAEVVQRFGDRVAERRTIVDLPRLLLEWLGYAWATNDGTNPLVLGNGMPSAAYVHAAHSLAGIELTPGLASTASCPEAMWQAVKWWHDYYAGVVQIGSAAEVGAVVPVGYYALRQRAAAVRLDVDSPLFMPEPAPKPKRAASRRTTSRSRKS
jgi:hypothetical protein